jgi:hypothetical protein
VTRSAGAATRHPKKSDNAVTHDALNFFLKFFTITVKYHKSMAATQTWVLASYLALTLDDHGLDFGARAA